MWSIPSAIFPPLCAAPLHPHVTPVQFWSHTMAKEGGRAKTTPLWEVICCLVTALLPFQQRNIQGFCPSHIMIGPWLRWCIVVLENNYYRLWRWIRLWISLMHNQPAPSNKCVCVLNYTSCCSFCKHPTLAKTGLHPYYHHPKNIPPMCDVALITPCTKYQTGSGGCEMMCVSFVT